MRLIRKIDFKKLIISDISNSKTFCIVTYAVLGLVGLVMTLLNIATDKGWLTFSTAIFAVACAANIVLTVLGPPTAEAAKILFAFAVLVMFTFFLVSGNPDGFSSIWICMLPSIGMFFFNRKRGSILCGAMLLILIFFLWVPFGQTLLMYDYTQTFRMRFPILFMAFFLLAFLLEMLREGAYNEMIRLQQYYEDLSIRDPLTGILNRQGMYSALEESEKFRKAKKIGVAMFDVDHFKEVNDKYGHNVGDEVLKTFSHTVNESLNGVVCRWGGEEFVAVFCDDDLKVEDLEEVSRIVKSHTYYAEEKSFRITASVGICTEPDFDVANIDLLIEKADEALYNAKDTGRDKIVLYGSSI